MKEILKATAIAIATSLLCGCGTSTKPAAATLPGAYSPVTRPAALRFVCITPCVDEPFFQQVSRGAADAATLFKVECQFTGTRGVDIPQQVSIAQRAVDSGCDGIALNLVDSTAFDEVIAQAHKKGIPVVAFNVNAQPKSRIPTVAQDLYAGGRAAALAAAPWIPSGSRVLITGHDGSSTATDPRQQGIRDGLADKGIRWKTVVTSGNVDEVEREIADALRADPDVRAIFATGLSNTEGAGHAVERGFSRRALTLVGFDSSPEVNRLMAAGVVQLNVDQQAYAQGFYPIVQLALARQRGIQPTNIDTGARVTTAGDLSRPELARGR